MLNVAFVSHLQHMHAACMAAAQRLCSWAITSTKARRHARPRVAFLRVIAHVILRCPCALSVYMSLCMSICVVVVRNRCRWHHIAHYGRTSLHMCVLDVVTYLSNIIFYYCRPELSSSWSVVSRLPSRTTSSHARTLARSHARSLARTRVCTHKHARESAGYRVDGQP